MDMSIDTDGGYAVVSFFVPADIPVDEITHLKGRVVVSCQDGVARGDGVYTKVRETIKYIIDNRPNNGATLYQTKLTPNTHPDPKWFASKVELPGEDESLTVCQRIGLAITVLQRAADQL